MIWEFKDMEDNDYAFKIMTEDYNFACMKYVEFLKKNGLVEVSLK